MSSIYQRLRSNPNHHRSINAVYHKEISQYERHKLDCWTNYYNIFSPNGIKLTDENNNPNFLEIVDNCRNCVPFDTINQDDSSRTVRNIGRI